MFTLNCRGKLLLIDSPVIMGIINVTPDSFYKGNIYDDILSLAKKMIGEGAGILDIGGQSTRPGSKRITAEEELQRVIPVVQLIRNNYPDIPLSIDTFYSDVARLAVQEGALIVNDISAGEMDKQMIATVASLNVPYICMHMKGTPDTMQQQAHYEDVVKDVLDFFTQKTNECTKAGINDVIIDPGFGFGKTATHNFQLLGNLHAFKMFNRPVLAGLSRKSTIYKTLGIDVSEALNGTTVLNTIALQNGADILRVHDVKEAKEAVMLVEAYRRSGNQPV